MFGLFLKLFFLLSSCSSPSPISDGTTPIAFDPKWGTPPHPTEEIAQALNQPYRYFGCGGQSYVFFSEDGRYALKLFKHHKYRPSPWSQSKTLKRVQKKERAFTSYKIAFEFLAPITEILYLHLNPTDTLLPSMIDGHLINLNQYAFLLQKRGELLLTAVNQTTIDQLIALIDFRCQLGYEDKDAHIETNCGLVDGHVMKIDVGRFALNPQMATVSMRYKERKRILSPLIKRLESTDPNLARYCEEQCAP